MYNGDNATLSFSQFANVDNLMAVKQEKKKPADVCCENRLHCQHCSLTIENQNEELVEHIPLCERLRTKCLIIFSTTFDF